MTDKFHDYLYGNIFDACTDNNPLTYVLKSAKLHATGHRWLAALSGYNIKLIYRSGKANGDADGLSRRPHETNEMFPDVVKAVCQAYTVKTDTCPYVETLVLNNKAQLIESEINDSEGFTSVGSTELSGVDWAKEQASDKTLNRVIELLISGYFPHKNEQRVETPEVSRYFRNGLNWKLLITSCIVYLYWMGRKLLS